MEIINLSNFKYYELFELLLKAIVKYFSKAFTLEDL